MARNADEGELARIAVEVSVQRLAEARAIVLATGKAGDLVGACPLCDDAEGLAVSPTSNVWACSSCGEGGGPVEWLMATEGVSKAHAVELLREGLPATSASTGRKPPKVNSRALLPAPFEPGTTNDDLLEQVVAFYHRTLREAPQPAAYLERRKLADSEMVEVFRLGFANRTLGYRLPEKNRAAGKVLRTQLQEIGVWSAKGHEAYDGSLVVPITDINGQLAQLYGRKIGQHLRKGTRLHTWLATTERPLFNPAALDVGDEVVLAGSVIDALTLWCAGFRHTIGVDGVEGFDDTHLAQLADAGVRSVRIAYRRDDTGEHAAARTAETLLAAGIECLRAEWPWGLDVNDYACLSKDTTGALGKVLRAASWMGKGTKPTRRRRQPSAAKPAAGASPQPDATTDVPACDVDAPAETPASVVAVEPDAVLDGQAMRVSFGERAWRVRGLENNRSFDVLKVQVTVSVPAVERGAGFHMDSFDLYSARARASFVRDAADEVGVEDKILKRDLGRVLMAAEALVEEAIRRAQEPDDTTVVLDADERAAALELLQDPKLVDRITDDFARVGMVGEATNCLVGYLATISRLLDKPLAVIVQSTSAAGKSALQDAVMDFVPAEELVRYSAMTGQSLYYLGEHDLAHKVLAIAEEEGAERASYALKLLQSEGELSIASTGKDNASGRLVTHPYRVQGPTVDLLDDDGDRDRRGADEPLRGAHRRRGPRADEGHPRPPTPSPDPRRHSRHRRPGPDPQGPPRCAAAAGTGRGGEPPRPPPHVRGWVDEDPAGSRQVLDPHPGHRAAAPTPTRAPHSDDAGRADGDLHRGHHRRHRAGQPPRPRGPGPLPRRAATPAPPTPRSPRRHGRRDRSGAGDRPGPGPVHPPPGPRAPRRRRHPVEEAPGPPGRSGARVVPPGRADRRVRLRAGLDRWPRRHPVPARPRRPRRPRRADHTHRSCGYDAGSVGPKGVAVGGWSAPGRRAVGPRSGPRSGPETPGQRAEVAVETQRRPGTRVWPGAQTTQS